MASSILNRIRSDSLPAWLSLDLDRWTVFWLVLLLTAVLRGLGIIAIGGGWFRARLWLSGVRTPCWGPSLRLYLGGRFVEQIVGVLALIAGTFLYSSPRAFLDSGLGTSLILVGSLLLLWGGVVPFLGARALFRLNRWSWLWLFALPIAWRLVIVTVGAWVGFGGGLKSSPYAWNEPGTVVHEGRVLSVVIGRTWVPTDRPDGVDVVRSDGRASWSATIVPTGEADAIALALGGTADPVQAPGPGTIGRWTGTRWEHRIGEDTVVVFDSQLDADHRVLFRLAAPREEWSETYTDLERCMASAFVVDPRIVGVDPAQMTTIESETLVFEVPSNWIIDSDSRENDELGAVRQITARSPGAAEIFALSYRSPQPADRLFEMTLAEMETWYTLDRKRGFSVWQGMPCVGVDAVGRTRRGMPIELRIVVLELQGDARAEVVTVSAPHEPASLRLGVRHFEESVRRKTSEP